MFCTFWLANVLLATAACSFCASELQKVLRHRQCLNILTSKCAFRYSGVQFFDIRTSKSAPTMRCFVHFDLNSGVQFLISPLTTWLRTRRFNSTFRLTRHTNQWKNAAFRDFSYIWRGCIFLLTFVLLHLVSADLTTLLSFSTVHIVGS